MCWLSGDQWTARGSLPTSPGPRMMLSMVSSNFPLVDPPFAAGELAPFWRAIAGATCAAMKSAVKNKTAVRFQSASRLFMRPPNSTEVNLESREQRSLHATHQTLDRSADQQKNNPQSGSPHRDGAEQLNKAHAFHLSRQQSGHQIAERCGQEPDAHHLAHQLSRRQLGHRAQAYRTQAKLAGCVEEVGRN